MCTFGFSDCCFCVFEIARFGFFVSGRCGSYPCGYIVCARVVRAAMVGVVQYARLVLVPGSSGSWDGSPRSPFRAELRGSLERELSTSSVSLGAGYAAGGCAARQSSLERTLRRLRTGSGVAIGHSEGCARLLHALRDRRNAAKLHTLVLISPAYALRSVGAVDVEAMLRVAGGEVSRLLLVDTELGFGGSAPEYAWPGTRGLLADAVRSNPRWQRCVVAGASHSLRHGGAGAAERAIVEWASLE